MSVEDLRFTPALLSKPAPSGLSVETTLHHFAILTYWVDPSRLREHLHPRFEPVCLEAEGASRRALISVVTFLARDFRLAAWPWLKGSFGQSNYRAYVLDTETGDHAVWFFGTCLDSLAVVVPRYVWQLPWHRATMAFDCPFDAVAQRYSRFRVTTRSSWSPGVLSLSDSGAAPGRLPGFANPEAAMVLLTHPLRGFLRRRDGALGSYAIWHDRARPTTGRVQEASYPLLRRLELVEEGDVRPVHSVLLQKQIDFTIRLPPARIELRAPG
jgi:uncharacterized protein YqjF (DUF2071 family)